MLLLTRRCGWSPGVATAVSDYDGRIFKQSAEQLSHATERERLSLDAVRESRTPVETRIM